MLRKRHELLGKRFGLGVVIKEIGTCFTEVDSKYPREYQKWLLQCDCGNQYELATRYLIWGNFVKSCGCLRGKNLLNQRFGKGVVIAFAGRRYRGDKSKRICKMWRLKCDCGKEYDATAEFLMNGDCSSCGCHMHTFHNVPSEVTNGNFTFNRYLHSVKAGAKSRNREFLVTDDYLLELFKKQNEKCALSGKPISFKNKTASLDRIDNNLPYQENNVQWVHRVINYMKNTLPNNTFIEWCQQVSDFSSGCSHQ